MNENHPLDEPLGEIHEVALLLEFYGYTKIALKLATAHEKIQDWVVNKDE